MEKLQIFNNEEFGNIRILIKNNDPWFVGKDVAEKLGYAEPRSAVSKKVDMEDRGVAKIETPSGIQEMTIINESGLYSLVLSSKLNNAKLFKKWITSEVLPSIRKHGAYMTEETLEKAITSPDFLIKLATELKHEQEKRKELEIIKEKQQQVIGELKPKADYTDIILKNKSTIAISKIAKDYGMSATAFNKILKDLKVQYKQGNQWLLYSKYHDKGYTHSETINIKDGYDFKMFTKWTQKGRLFLYELLKQHNILPTIEK